MAKIWVCVGCAGWLGFIGCSGGDGSSDSQQVPPACVTFCDMRQQLGCPSNDARTECEAGCARTANLEPQCSSAFVDMVNCGTSAPMKCNGRGEPQITVDCLSQAIVHDECMTANGWERIGSAEPCSVYSCPGYCAVLECWECQADVDCAPNETCVVGTCRQRCLEDADCPSSRCVSGECAAPLGSPCEDAFDCGGGPCINVDANLMTVESYCSMSCISEPCPGGYVCQEFECRRL